MKILHLPHGYPPARGGAEDLIAGLSKGLAARGHDVRIVVANLATPEGLYRFGIGPSADSNQTIDGVSVRRIDPGIAYRVGNVAYRRDPYSATPTANRLRRSVSARLSAAIRTEIEAFRPDVVLALPHLFENVRIAFEIRRRDPFPLAWMPLLHEDDPYWPFDDVRRLLPAADAVVAMTAHEATRLVDGYGAEPDRIHVIPPGVVAPTNPPEQTTGPPTVLYLGRIAASKGIDRLARSMDTVWRTVPDAHVILAGASTLDTAGIQAVLTSAAARSGTGTVDFLPDFSDSDKQGLLRSASVLVLPSTVESFGIVLLEAWASATPVVALDTPTMRDVVTDGVDGLLVGPDDDRAMAEAIIACLADPDRARSMGLAGFRKVGDSYSWAKAARHLEAVYRSIRDR